MINIRNEYVKMLDMAKSSYVREEILTNKNDSKKLDEGMAGKKN